MDCKSCERPDTEVNISVGRRECNPCRARKAKPRDPVVQAQRNRINYLSWKYGITEAMVEEMRIAQGGHCKLCPCVAPLRIDHDHETGVLRGLLCPGCNSALGNLGDDPDRLRAAAAYIESFRQ